MKIHYTITLHWSEEDQAFIAEVPELPGCAADGETPEQILESHPRLTRESIQAALAFASGDRIVGKA